MPTLDGADMLSRLSASPRGTRPSLAGYLGRCYEESEVSRMLQMLMNRLTRLAVVATAVVAGLLGGIAPFGCAAASAEGTQRLADGRYELKCEGSLSHCLEQADEICRGTRYRVLQGSDDRDYVGPEEHFEREIRTSHAIIRCGSRGQSLFGKAEEPEPTTAIATRGHSACVPGATQSCVGPAGCVGGQACLPDGSGFSPCDCGGATHPESATTPGTPSESDTPLLVPPTP